VIRVYRAELGEIGDAFAIVDEYCRDIGIDVRDDPDEFATYFAPDSGVWLARGVDGVIGCVALRPLPIPGAAEVKRLYVRTAYRGRRFASDLLDALEAYAKARDYRYVYLDTKDDLIPAIRFYERRGYTRVERYNDNPQATIFMRRNLR
jgi:ribosomal protein S18 acetylase RimI-like enzyme